LCLGVGVVVFFLGCWGFGGGGGGVFFFGGGGGWVVVGGGGAASGPKGGRRVNGFLAQKKSNVYLDHEGPENGKIAEGREKGM